MSSGLYDIGGWTKDEEMIVGLRFDEWARTVTARVIVEAEEGCATSVESTRPTVPVFQGEPWR